VESHVSTEAKETVGLVKKEEKMEQDLVRNSEIILATGIVIIIPTVILKMTRSRRPRQSPKPKIQRQNLES
jgi:hypothetical protein